MLYKKPETALLSICASGQYDDYERLHGKGGACVGTTVVKCENGAVTVEQEDMDYGQQA